MHYNNKIGDWVFDHWKICQNIFFRRQKCRIWFLFVTTILSLASLHYLRLSSKKLIWISFNHWKYFYCKLANDKDGIYAKYLFRLTQWSEDYNYCLNVRVYKQYSSIEPEISANCIRNYFKTSIMFRLNSDYV